MNAHTGNKAGRFPLQWGCLVTQFKCMALCGSLWGPSACKPSFRDSFTAVFFPPECSLLNGSGGEDKALLPSGAAGAFWRIECSWKQKYLFRQREMWGALTQPARISLPASPVWRSSSCFPRHCQLPGELLGVSTHERPQAGGFSIDMLGLWMMEISCTGLSQQLVPPPATSGSQVPLWHSCWQDFSESL